jgi:SNF2 family DNA or RNA helicase
MTPEVKMSGAQVIVVDKTGAITGKHSSQLNYWGFQYDSAAQTFTATAHDPSAVVDKLLSYLTRHDIPHTISEAVAANRATAEQARMQLLQAIAAGRLYKNAERNALRASDFLEFLSERIPRKLKDHQIKAALHLLAVRNGANFSVPGSGKTTVVLAVFQWLRTLGQADSLFVIGPPSCFGPWRAEYHSVIGSPPTVEILAGGDAEDRRTKYGPVRKVPTDLYLTTYQTLQRDWERVNRLFKESGTKFYLVVDEAHYIKQLDGVWASAVLNIAPHASIRCVLTGTPFPRTYADAFNLFDVLWPSCPPLNQSERSRIDLYTQKRKDAEAGAFLDQRIGPLFYRVRKNDLGLAPQVLHPPVRVQMNKYERLAYDSILDNIKTLSKEDYFRDLDLLLRLRRGRMMRLRQAVSYAKLLGTAVLEYNEDLLGTKLSLADLIKHYDDLETPAKLQALLPLVSRLRQQGEKVLIWSNFVKTLKLIRHNLLDAGHGTQLIYGDTPTENSSMHDALTREKIIAQFVEPSSGTDVLVANPAACAESISLHKTCSHAIYYDLSYNCAQYLQSLDRIHRVGGSENKPSHYYFIHYSDTIDDDILHNVRKKSGNMSAVIDRDYPIYSLDMFSLDEELEAYKRLFG